MWHSQGESSLTFYKYEKTQNKNCYQNFHFLSINNYLQLQKHINRKQSNLLLLFSDFKYYFLYFQRCKIILFIRLIQETILLKMTQEKVHTIEEVSSGWSAFSQTYEKYDSAPQTFYYSLLNKLNLIQANSILQVGCGTGKLIPYALTLKHPNSKYYATDLVPQMVQYTKQSLKKNFQRYQSEISFQQWCKQQNILVEVANGQQKMRDNLKFDRIICNLVLIHTPEPQKMLRNLYQMAQQDCQLALSVWGNRELNNFFNTSEVLLKASGNWHTKSKFFLYKQVQKLLEKTGWEIVLNWEQNTVYPFVGKQYLNHDNFLYAMINWLPPEKKEPIREQLSKQYKKYFEEDKNGLHFQVQMLICRKKTHKN